MSTFWRLIGDPSTDPRIIRVYRWLQQWPEAQAFPTLVEPSEVSRATRLTPEDTRATLATMIDRGYLILDATRSDGAMWIIAPLNHEPQEPQPQTPRVRGPGMQDGRTVSPTLRWKILERDGHRCRGCGSTAEDAKLVIDHIKPFSKGGPTIEANLQTLCFECNAGKRDKYVESTQ